VIGFTPMVKAAAGSPPILPTTNRCWAPDLSDVSKTWPLRPESELPRGLFILAPHSRLAALAPHQTPGQD
jgi:hypothetical protein